MEVKIEIYTEPIQLTRGLTRRQAELNASEKMIKKRFGQSASLEHDPEGRPFISGARFDGMISISHSADQCILAVTSSQEASIGVDTETWREQLLRVASKFLSAEELTVYTTPKLLLLAWTTKEAVYKAARREGLPLKEIKLPVPPPVIASFPAVANGKTFNVTSIHLSDTRATTTAYFI